MKNNSFYALALRMKYINRWGLMKNTQTENVAQHSLDTAIIAHALAVINNEIFGGNISPEKTAAAAMYHDISEIITGDMPTPVKYFNNDIVSVYKQIENGAKINLLTKLPVNLRNAYEKVFFFEDDKYMSALIKGADKLSAYIKCIEEENSGNGEFKKAKKSTEAALKAMNLPEIDYFTEHFIPAFYLTLDEI